MKHCNPWVCVCACVRVSVKSFPHGNQTFASGVRTYGDVLRSPGDRVPGLKFRRQKTTMSDDRFGAGTGTVLQRLTFEAGASKIQRYTRARCIAIPVALSVRFFGDFYWCHFIVCNGAKWPAADWITENVIGFECAQRSTDAAEVDIRPMTAVSWQQRPINSIIAKLQCST